MDKKGLIALLLIFILMGIFNFLFPMMNEDYFGAFVWPQGVPNLGELPDNATRLSNYSDVLENNRVYYLTEGGRIPGSLILGTLFWNLGKAYFNPFNALILTLLVTEIYWIAHEGRVSFVFNASYIAWIFFSLWAFNLGFLGTCLWMSGSSNYLWMVVINLAFLMPYIRNYYDQNSFNQDSLRLRLSMFFGGILAGWSHETTVCWLILILLYWLVQCKKADQLHSWKILGFIGLCFGYALLILAPGNFARLHTQEHELFSYKFSEFIILTAFHLFLWYYVIKALFIIQHNLLPSLPCSQHKIVKNYLNIAKASILVAFGSDLIMLFIPVSGIRPSFLSLVFLILAAFTLYRVQELTGLFIIKGRVKAYLKLLGLCYLIMTIMVSLYWNYKNWNSWNDVLAQINDLSRNHPEMVLEVEPYPTSKKPLWHLISGFHIFGMPVVSDDEHDRINRIVAKYYNIKGIRLRKND